MGYEQRVFRVIFGFSSILYVALSSTDPNDVRILNEFRKGLENPDLLKWPENGDDPCGPPLWPHVFCNRDRVAQIQVQGLGLKGPLPQDFNQLSKLVNLGLQRNHFNGNLPSFSGLSELEYAYLDYNDFDTIPSDFFDGLTSIRVMALDNNPLNATAGWSLPNVLGASTQLVNLSLSSCNLVGLLPDFLGTLSSLSALKLSYNRLSGVIPMSFNQSTAQILWLNDQNEPGMTGPIDIISSMASLSQLWLQGNSFTGTIPDGIGKLDALRDLNLNRNQLVGLIPRSLAAMDLVKLDMSNNMLMGPIPEFKSSNVSYASNSFCQTSPGTLCALEVNALIDFLSGLNYPIDLASEWTGNDPCNGPWLGVSCNAASKVTIINLPKRKLQGALSPSIGNLDLLHEIRLSGNNLSGQIPTNLTQLKSLRLLDVSGNNFQPPLPQFRPDVKVIVDGNPLLVTNPSKRSPQIHHPPINSTTPPVIVQSPQKAPSPTPSLGSLTSPPFRRKHTPVTGSSHDSRSSLQGRPKHQKSNGLKRFRIAIIVAAIASFLILVLLSILVYLYRYKNQKDGTNAPRTVVFHPRNSSDPENMVKIAVLSNTGSLFTHNESDTGSMDSGNLTISVQVLRKVTDNFAPKNELGRGGFGVVYKGELDDGTKIAVKRMEAGAICNKALDEFKSEIAVLSKVRHRHLVSLFGYSTEDNERLLVYEYMPKGALSKHLFHWKNFGLEPLMWKRRLMIALDVARGMEYLHSMAHQSFIHRDLKPSNILLDDEYRAKVSDFGLVKLAPDREKSVVTRLAGTFGYLAPEYAVTGKVTTKIDVFSYGVVLMELLTGLMALDEGRPEESRYLAEWFWRIKTSRDKLISAIDPVLNVKEDTSNSISVIAELAGYCTARDPNRRPDMGHAVSVLAPLVEQWKPFDDDSEDHSGIDLNQPLKEMLKGWQREGDEKEYSSNASFEDSLGSIPARPTGFADSFTSAYAR